MAVCVHCGSELPPAAAFCPACAQPGRALPTRPPPAPVDPATSSAPRPPAQPPGLHPLLKQPFRELAAAAACARLANLEGAAESTAGRRARRVPSSPARRGPGRFRPRHRRCLAPPCPRARLQSLRRARLPVRPSPRAQLPARARSRLRFPPNSCARRACCGRAGEARLADADPRRRRRRLPATPHSVDGELGPEPAADREAGPSGREAGSSGPAHAALGPSAAASASGGCDAARRRARNR